MGSELSGPIRIVYVNYLLRMPSYKRKRVFLGAGN